MPDIAPPGIEPFRALIVEDWPIVALDLESSLRTLGALDVQIACTLDDAANILATFQPDIAFLDIGVGTDTSIDLAASLADAGVAVVFTTGTATRREIPGRLASCQLVAKPYGPQHIETALRSALSSRSAEPTA